MSWHYLLLFLTACLLDIFPIPLPPAFTAMIFFQVKYNLDIWLVILVGVAGSVVGRFILTLYIPKVSARIFTKGKNKDVEFLGRNMKKSKWRSNKIVFVYSLMPLPTTPLFIAAGMAKIKPAFIIPAFLAGKLISNTVMVLIGDYAAKNTDDLLEGVVSWKSILGLAGGLILILAILFIDWRTLLTKKKLHLKFNIFKNGKERSAKVSS